MLVEKQVYRVLALSPDDARVLLVEDVWGASHLLIRSTGTVTAKPFNPALVELLFRNGKLQSVPDDTLYSLDELREVVGCDRRLLATA